MRTRWLDLLALTAALAACGGGDGAPGTPLAGMAGPAARDGGERPMPTAATASSVDGAAPAVQSIAESQADAWAAFGGVIEVLVEPGPAREVALERAEAQRLRATRGLPLDTPVLVRGADPALAMVVADRLVASGHKAVWLVTP